LYLCRLPDGTSPDNSEDTRKGHATIEILFCGAFFARKALDKIAQNGYNEVYKIALQKCVTPACRRGFFMRPPQEETTEGTGRVKHRFGEPLISLINTV